MYRITVLPHNRILEAQPGENLRLALARGGFAVDAPCGGQGTCGKCRVQVDGQEVLACRQVIDRNMTVLLSGEENASILTGGITQPTGGREGLCLAFDIGTTTVAGWLLDGPTGRELACESTLNPQVAFGADVISRIQHALRGHMKSLTGAIRDCVSTLAEALCENADASHITSIAVVGNPAMQQIFLGILPENLAQVPFRPVLTQAEVRKGGDCLPLCRDSDLLIVPNISGFVGADTLACILATGLHEQEELTLLVDIGTNGEMVLGSRHGMVACSAAAGPALEGANIRFGMRGQKGAIDHVWLENGQLRCSVIGGGEAVGICGSGILDAVAAALNAGLLNERGNILREDRKIPLTDRVYLTQEDIRQVQLAKGAISAGIEGMAAHLGVKLEDIRQVFLAGAFGSFLNPASACRIGLLPALLEPKITAVGNAAGSGAKMLACHPNAAVLSQTVAGQVSHLELASAPGFRRLFADNMRFSAPEGYWCQRALSLGFSQAVPLDVGTLEPRQDVRDMCAADKCRAYGKNWTCPPLCGDLAACGARMKEYSHGILVQTVGRLSKTVDTKAYRQTEARHLAQFRNLCRELRKTCPEALFLSSGGCRICPQCAWPEPCRFPEEACSSMEAYGLFVTQVCRDNNCQYHHGEKTVTYTACILF